MTSKPKLEDVLKYAKGNIMRFIAEKAPDLPPEQKEEIEQSVYLRLIQAYEQLDPDAGWKSFVFNHCRGGVLDYIKFGKGFEETKWSIQKEESEDAKHFHKLKTRITEVKSSKSEADESALETILERFGISKNPEMLKIQINWRLIECMAVDDEALHAFAKYLLGFSVDEIATVFDKCNSRISQLIQAFIDRFDDPALVDDIWFKQTCFAFGLCRLMGIPEVDQSEIQGYPIGWSSRRVDLYRDTGTPDTQLSLFDAG